MKEGKGWRSYRGSAGSLRLGPDGFEVGDEVEEGVFGAVEGEGVETCGGGGLPVGEGVVAGVEGVGGGDAGEGEGLLEDVGVGFVGADLAGDGDDFEPIEDAEVFEEGAEAGVEVGDDA